MKGWVIAVVIVVALVTAVTFYMLLSRGGQEVALLNAERLLSENFTGTYRLTESQLINTSLISEVLQINGVVTISRSPLVVLR